MINYILHLADNALVLGHRNSEWTGHGPILEQDIALSNISLDLIGQARHLYQYAASIIGNGATEDSLAYLRGPEEFRNCLLVELPKGHWGTTILRQFLFSAYQYPLYTRLSDSPDQHLNAVATKTIKEVTYHLRWSSEWVIRLGQGTEESHSRMTDAVTTLWPYTEDLLSQSAPEQDEWNDRVKKILEQAGLVIPEKVKMMNGGFEGRHTRHLSKMLIEMQQLQRKYPGAEW